MSDIYLIDRLLHRIDRRHADRSDHLQWISASGSSFIPRGALGLPHTPRSLAPSTSVQVYERF
jgi:hypothetical protein